MSREAFQSYWLGQHAKVVKRVARQIGAQRYVQNHTYSSQAADRSNTARGSMIEPFDGVTEFWWQSEADLLQPQGSTPEQLVQAQKELLEDEREFIDLVNSTIFICQEQEIFNYLNPQEAQS